LTSRRIDIDTNGQNDNYKS